MENLIRTTG